MRALQTCGGSRSFCKWALFWPYHVSYQIIYFLILFFLFKVKNRLFSVLLRDKNFQNHTQNIFSFLMCRIFTVWCFSEILGYDHTPLPSTLPRPSRITKFVGHVLKSQSFIGFRWKQSVLFLCLHTDLRWLIKHKC